MTLSNPTGSICYVHASSEPFSAGATVRVVEHPRLMSFSTTYQPMMVRLFFASLPQYSRC